MSEPEPEPVPSCPGGGPVTPPEPPGQALEVEFGDDAGGGDDSG